MAANPKVSPDAEAEVVRSDAAPLPAVVVVDPAVTAGAVDPAVTAEPDVDSYKWIRRAVFLGILVIGWVFIGWQNRFYFSAPIVFVGLAYLAVVSTMYALWRTGVTAVADDHEVGDATWGRPVGRRGEMEREKRTLLKAIKEAEFDREMGKLSTRDAESMISVYRLRAIEVIKEIDKIEAGEAGSVREQIAREVKARLEMEAKTSKAKADAKTDADKKKARPKAGEAKLRTTPTENVSERDAEARVADAKAERDAIAAGINPTEFDSTEAVHVEQPSKEASS